MRYVGIQALVKRDYHENARTALAFVIVGNVAGRATKDWV